jgi:Putative transposase
VGGLLQAPIRRSEGGTALSRPLHPRVAISNRRLIACDQKGVSFKWKDYRLEGRERYKLMTLATHEFIRRWRAGDELGQPAKVLRDRCQRELELSAARPTPTPRRLGRKSRLCASGDHAGFELWPLLEDPMGWFSLELRRPDPKSGVSFLIQCFLSLAYQTRHHPCPSGTIVLFVMAITSAACRPG